ncbi:MAG: beta-propeller domain-containing protein [Clostridia bacterium]
MKKIWIFAILFFLLIPFSFAGCSFDSPNVCAKNFESRNEINEVVNKFDSMWKANNIFSGGDLKNVMISDSVNEAESSVDYTETNVQIEGVDEGDIIKVDGTSIFKLTEKGFVIVNVSNGLMEIASNIEIENYVPKEMFLMGNKAIIIGGRYEVFEYYGSREIGVNLCKMSYMNYSKTDIRIYDISVRTNPILERQILVEGRYLSSRIVDNKFVFMMSYSFSFGDETNYVPKISDSTVNDGVESEIAFDDLYYFDNIPVMEYLIIGNIDFVESDNNKIVGYLGLGGEICVSEENIYICDNDYSLQFKKILWWINYDSSEKPQTRIVKIFLPELLFVGSATIDGTILNRYSVDEYDSYLRVATTTRWWDESKGTQSYSSVFVFDANMNETGSITNIASGESIYSVKFNEATGSLVTFLQTDPLYKLDLSNPYNPIISTGLKEDGVSMYLHYIDDTRMIGVGRDSETVNGIVVWKGLKVTLYDVSGTNAVAINTIKIGSSWSYAEILNNPKSLLYDKERDIFAFSAEKWEIDDSNENYIAYKMTEQGLYVFGFTSGTLTLKNVSTNITNFDYDDWYGYYDLSYDFVTRGARIGDYVYTLSEHKICSYSLSSFQKISELVICEFVPSIERFESEIELEN